MGLARGVTRSTGRASLSRAIGSDGGSSGVGPSYDTDAQAYITAVEAEDGESLESGVKDAINAFVVGCKSDGIWDAIKASCILAGARTLDGALVPLVGSAPTNSNFVSGDYSRTTGLTGNGTTKQLNANRPGNADPQNNIHISSYLVTGRDGGSGRYVCSDVGLKNIVGGVTGFRARVNGLALRSLATVNSVPCLLGVSRSASDSFNWVGFSESGSQLDTSATPTGTPTFVFSAGGNSYVNSTLAFYSVGESLNLSSLNSRVTTLVTAIGTALA